MRARGNDQVLFCPFCRDAFEGQTRCPDHDLALLPWRALPRARRSLAADEPLAWYSLRLGRGLVAAGAVLTLSAFTWLPLARVHGGLQMGGTMLSLALAGGHKLWLVPTAALSLLSVLARRRTPLAMRGARLALLFSALVAPASVCWALSGAREAVALLAGRSGQRLQLELASGSYVVWLAALAAVLGALRLGGPLPEPGDGNESAGARGAVTPDGR